ncbi:Carboxypeptidase A4 [Podila clonocystis]|nr:Carboxypeptidase A4 [Podila clonocystis]
MRSVLTTIPLALTLSVLSLAYPTQWSQHPFTHINTHHAPTETEGYARFDEDKVFRVEVSSVAELKQLEETIEAHNFDLWSNLRVGTVDVRVPSESVETFQSLVHMPTTVMIPNVQDLVPDQTQLLRTQSQGQWNYTDDSFWANYHDLATLNNFTETMISEYPDLVTRVSMGHTFEGREVFGMSIHGGHKRSGLVEGDEDKEDDEEIDLEEMIESWWSWLFGSTKKPKHNKMASDHKKKNKDKKKKAIVIHGGQHAREWIGPAVVSYIAKELLTGYGHHKKITRLIDQFEFVVVPVLNADGYEYTWTTNRMWRKNRQPTSIPFCKGIDPNRNWGFMWNHGGSSSNPCNDGYHGPEAFAALEPKMMADYITEKGNTPKDDEDIIEAAMGAAKALKDVHGTKFAVGSVCNIIYQASGGSLDWTYGEAGVKYSYAVELRDTGKHGFLLPEDQILPSAEETYAGFQHLVNFIRKREKQWRW